MTTSNFNRYVKHEAQMTSISTKGLLEISSLRLALTIFSLLLTSISAFAQAPAPVYRCPDGEYNGRQSGKTRYLKDPYTWFVTREFAQRFCMPAEFISDELKGAEAIAFRYKPSDVQSCQVVNGTEVCGQGHVLLLELYVKSSANIPKYDPEVDFFVRETFTSGSVLSNLHNFKNSDRRRLFQWDDPLGRRVPFYGTNRRDNKPRTSFILLGLQADETVRFKTTYVEDYYHSQWAEGIDVIGVTQRAMANPAGVARARLDRSEAIGVLSGYLGNEEQVEVSKRRLSDFLHVIELPKRLSDLKLNIGIQEYEKLQRAMSGITNQISPKK